ncbi:hypothetical protein GFB49_00120 [Epibacterium sp. SM1979]|uniref:Uncharacterized protein n=1 Tax=Tritonibacter litoralis TaxID=2662264 RepID=A0A843YCS2_9RHOB|nr:hypothetical protein [Tritonibacter litoralis]MQQ06849.1 hypothetical protein [Tritonibacter litoralis]
MKSFGTATFGAVAALFLATSQAAALEYLCEFKNPSSRKTIPEQVLVKVSPDGSSADIIDPFLLHYGQAPLKASSFSDNDKLMKAKWLLKADTGGAYVKFSYFLVFRKARGKASISLTPHGYDNSESGTGSCKIRT